MNLVSMGKKKRSWFSFLKKLFIPHTKSKVEKKKTRKWGWIFGGVKIKQYPEIGCKQMKLCEATEEQRKQVVAVAIATAAAAEAAVTRLQRSSNSLITLMFLAGTLNCLLPLKFNALFADTSHEKMRHLVQAKKALSAMRGLVKLQAVIRGENVRRRIHIIPKSNRMNLLEKSPCRIHRIRVPLNDKEWMQSLSHNILMDPQESNIHDTNKSWDLSVASKEEMETLWLRKEEAFTKRERMTKNSYSHRESIRRENARDGYGFNRVDLLQQRESRRSKHSTFPDYLSNDHTNNTRQTSLNSNASTKQDSTIEALNSPVALRRRSFSHTKQESIGGDDDISLLNSPVFPTYMATTQSAKAKFRSTRMPKQRLIVSESYSGQHSPYKSKLSYLSSFNGDMNSSCRNTGIFKF